MPKTFLANSTYSQLLNRVRMILIEGQKRIEAQRVRTYWETGRIIHEHILKYKDRADYGSEVFKRLEKDLAVDLTVLQRCVKFAKIYPRLSNYVGQRNFNWGHYQRLITISNPKERLRIERLTHQHSWTAEELTAHIKEERSVDQSSATSSLNHEPRATSAELLTPLRGELFTYQLVERPTLGEGESGLLVDLGFGIFHNVDARLLTQFVKGDIVESRPKDDAYKFFKTNRTPKSLYTYQAYVEKVIDADTIKVRLDLGFDVWTRQVLRLRDLNAAELDTKEGQEAKVFIQSHVKESAMIIVRSSRSDKYDRYLADIFIPQGGETNPETDLYLNNLLLEKGFAQRWEG